MYKGIDAKSFEEVDGIIFKVYDENDWTVMTMDTIMDSVSTLAINSYNRPAPPAKV
jgi:hypothetical protein